MSVSFFTEDIKYNHRNKIKTKNWIKQTINQEGKQPGDINIIFTSNNNILKINQQYLSHNYFTDIITFNYCEKNTISGDIYISIETVKNNSSIFSVSYQEEISRVIIHGILHLLDYNDSNEKEKAQMREKENYYLDRFKNLS